MATNIVATLSANGAAMTAEINKTVGAVPSIFKRVSAELGDVFGDGLKKGVREMDVAIRASKTSIDEIRASMRATNGAIQIDSSGMKAALAAKQQQLQMSEALLTATTRLAAKESDASREMQVHLATLRATVDEERQSVAAINAKIRSLDALQAELGQTAVQQSKVNAVSGQTRAGMQQLSFQISDVATSFAGGINPMVIFAQQGSQVVQSLALMGNGTNKLIGFLGGPWGAAIMGAVTVLGMFWASSDEATKKTDILTDRIDLQKMSTDELASSISTAIEQLERQNRTARESAELSRNNAIAAREEAISRLQVAKSALNQSMAQKALLALQLSGGNLAAFVSSYQLINKALQENVSTLDQQILQANKLIGLTSANVSKEVKKEAEARERAADAAEREAKSKQRNAEALARENVERAKMTKFLSPVDGRVTSGFGNRINPVTGKSQLHGGVDYAVGIGTPVRAPASGVVQKVGRNSANGLFVKIAHGAGTETMFLHLDKADVVEGQVLSAGEYFAKSGNSGRSTGPHLDYRVLRKGKTVNPTSGTFPTDPSQFGALETKLLDDGTQALERREEVYKRISGQVSEEITKLRTVADIDALRLQGLTGQADKEEAIAALRARYRELLEGEPAIAAKILGITEDQVRAMRDQLKIAEQLTVEQVQRNADKEATKKYFDRLKEGHEKVERDQKERRDKANEEAKRQMDELASFYERAFQSGGKSIWSDFKQLGRRALAELAAQASLSLLSSGGQGGVGNFIGNLFGIGNVVGSGSGGSSLGGGLSSLGQAGGISGLSGISSAAGPAAALISLNQGIAKALGNDQIKNGMLSSLIIGPILTKLFGSAKRGSATLAFTNGELGVGATRGNSGSRISAAKDGIGSLADTLNQIAEALGGTISGAGSVSLGIRKKTYVVDPTGQGRTKGAGVLKFKDEQDAIEAAMRDALQDGVIDGISAASKKILASGQDLQKAIQKASLIESIPKALKARLNPVGAALDELNEKWDKTIAALKEGGATAEQMADAERLYRLERQDALTAANDNLKEFINSLNFGSSSTYSLVDQSKAARAELDQYLGKINSGNFAEVDQQKYLAAAQAFLEIQRELGGSGTGWFNSVDELRTATQRLADGLAQGTNSAAGARDPFAELTATSTQATAEILAQQSGMLMNIQNYLAALANGTVAGSSFIGANRAYLAQAV